MCTSLPFFVATTWCQVWSVSAIVDEADGGRARTTGIKDDLVVQAESERGDPAPLWSSR